jgi:hypothetical protein
METKKTLYIINPEAHKLGWALCEVYNPDTDLYDKSTEVPETQLVEWIKRVKARNGFVPYPFEN